MREWQVRKPSTDVAPLDWTIPEPVPPPRPDSVQTPWGEIYRSSPDGYWRVRAYDPPLSYPALLDKIDRFELRWHMLRPGICYRMVPLTPQQGGARLAVLWRNRDGSYRSGHVALSGPKNGVWLTEREPFRRAASRAEMWWLGMHARRRGFVTPEQVAARLSVAAPDP